MSNNNNKAQNNESVLSQYVIFAKWFLIAVLSGGVIGVVGAIFHNYLDVVTELRTENPWFLYLLPVAGLLIVLCYKIAGLTNDKGTNGIILGARGEEIVSVLKAPVIIIATLLTHCFGGSAGREGAALQLGGSLISPLRKPLKLNDEDYSILIMSGMAAGFSALFGTPIAAAVFATEVTVIGVTKYSAIVPCMLSSVTASIVASCFGVHPTAFDVGEVAHLSAGTAYTVFQTIFIGIFCALISMLFCYVMEETAALYKKFFANPFIRVLIGGVIIIALSTVVYLITGRYDYNGAGADVIARAFAGDARPEAFILKLIFTALTLGAGFKGGEIVPSMFIGATFGSFFGGLIGMDPALGAAVGLVGVFCGVTNCPFASMLLAVELFGFGALPYCAVSISLSYMLSGYTGLYSAQKFYASKITGAATFEKLSTYDDIKDIMKKSE